jgi:hypothetical protein
MKVMKNVSKIGVADGVKIIYFQHIGTTGVASIYAIIKCTIYMYI